MGINEADEQAVGHPPWGLAGPVGGPAQMLAHQLGTVVSAAAGLLGITPLVHPRGDRVQVAHHLVAHPDRSLSLIHI